MHMTAALLGIVALTRQVAITQCSPLRGRSKLSELDPAFAVNVQVGGRTYTNKGLVAFGLIPSNFTESTGDTLGGIGSGIAFKRGSFSRQSDGTFTGTLIVQPDRGFNVDGTINWQNRQHQIDFVLTPYYGTADQSFDDALKTLELTYRNTLLYTERDHQKTTGLDALGVRPAQALEHSTVLADPVLPIAPSNGRLSLDTEGLVLNADGTFWASDEYGPYIYLMSAQGELIEAVQPPEAILPLVNGTFNFTSEINPETGRAANLGFEGLTVDPTGRTLYALLQSATIQDGGSDNTTSRFTRLLAFDASMPLLLRPPLIGEWIVPLPQNDKGETLAASEVHFVSENVFLVLARDANGHGSADLTSTYKHADLLDISNATDIHDTKFDDPSHPIAPNGVLDASITPGTYVSFVDFINETQLGRFGVHNGAPADRTLIDGKWESLALAPCGDLANPHDFFLFTAADNDFISTQGISLGKPFNAGLDNDNQFMVFRVTLPDAQVSGVESEAHRN